MVRLRHFNFWCYKVLPLVYDDSLSYYEVLCKVTDYINKLIDSDRELAGEIEELKEEMKTVQEWIDNFDTSYIEDILEKWVATFVMFGLTDTGYFVAYIPESWKTINFATTGYDIDIPLEPEYGHLVLLY